MNQPHAHQRPRPWIFALLLLAGPALAFDVEMAPVTVQDTFTTPASTTVTFLQPFDTVPVVVTLATNEGGDPANLRITNVTTTGFTLVVTEPPANDGPHVAMNTAYLAVEPGSHTLPGGGQLQAYTAQTTATVSRFSGVSWDSLVFSNAFPSAPAVLANLQTMNNEAATPPTTSATPFLATAIDNVNASGLQFALERAESTQGAVTVPEVVGIVVMTDGSVTDFFDQGGNPVRLQAARTPDVIRGFSDGCFSVNWPVPFFGVPLAVASQNTRAGNNGGWLRRCSAAASALGLAVDEDIDSDSERNHTTEVAGIVGASRAFHANFAVELSLSKTVTTLSDPTNGAAAPYAIPGAFVQYTVALTNLGNLPPDADSITVTDQVPITLALCVANTCQAGGSVILDDGSSPTPPGVALGNVRYSNDGGASFSYVPVPDSDGFDPSINALSVSLTGQLAAVDSAGAPVVALRFTARVD